MITGIYKITCRKNGKVYIGQSEDIGRRKTEHWTALLKGKHPNSRLQKDFKEFGRSFAFEVVEICAVPLLNERELFWIKEYKATDPAYGYNKSTAPYKRKKKRNKKK